MMAVFFRKPYRHLIPDRDARSPRRANRDLANPFDVDVERGDMTVV